MKNLFAKSALVLALSLFTAQQANAFVLVISAIEPKNNPHGPTMAQKALLVGVAFLTHPINGILMLLDDHANAYEMTAKKFVDAGAPREEAEDLAIVIVNSAMKSGGKDVVIPSEEVEAAAPTFSKSENFAALLNQKI
jgi:hypothetical protein